MPLPPPPPIDIFPGTPSSGSGAAQRQKKLKYVYVPGRGGAGRTDVRGRTGRYTKFKPRRSSGRRIRENIVFRNNSYLDSTKELNRLTWNLQDDTKYKKFSEYFKENKDG